ncbi:MAG TPA: GAF domain-containing protein [Anaerolineae bacterium]|nr:GAF domain-containing protein [Anaerolineae bacterium]
MSALLRRFLVPRVSEDEETTRVARLLNAVLLSVLVASALIVLVAALFQALRPDPETVFTLVSGAAMTLVVVVLLILARRGRLRLVSILFLGLTLAVTTIWIYGVAGISSDSSVLAYALMIVLAGLLLGGRGALLATAISLVAVSGAYWLETSGFLVVTDLPVTLGDLFFVAIPLILTGVLLYYAMNSISAAIDRARKNELAQIEANRELEVLRASLEDRVTERTRELERRSQELQAATEVSRAATSILDVEELIWQVVELIQLRFGLYHVGLLLLDQGREWAVYRAGSGVAGRELREQGFRLEVGEGSIVGWCAAKAQVRVAQDVTTDTMHVEQTLLPLTRSEAALPLIARGQVLGVLSVQSDRPGAFDGATVAVLQTMADQVAVALDNARLFSEAQEALEATRRAYGQLSRQAWLELLSSRADWGYAYAHQTVEPIRGEWRPEMLEAMQTGQIIIQNFELDPVSVESREPSRAHAGTAESSLVLPLKVREDTIGILSFYKDSEDAAWTPREMEFLQRLVAQLGSTLESAQLFQESQRRAAREQAIRQVTERMRSAVEVETVLQNTIVELAKALGAPRAYIRLGTEAELLAGRRAEPGDGHPSMIQPENRTNASEPFGVDPVDGDAQDA